MEQSIARVCGSGRHDSTALASEGTREDAAAGARECRLRWILLRTR
jgi:hypothetical protein